MGMSLDQLLDATGVDQLAGTRLRKEASASPAADFSKLAERCRRAADTQPEERDRADEQGLVEKTAAIHIIGKTLAEIREIEGAASGQVKTAAVAPGPNEAAFIKSALDAGHSPEDIAAFLDRLRTTRRRPA